MLVIEGRFNGPPGSGNGGYTAGLIASHLAAAGQVQVTLRVPPPLDTPLRFTAEGAVEVYAGDQLVAEVQPVDDLPTARTPTVEYEEAVRASAGYPGFADHPFPTCYVCGPERAEGDGLRIFPGPLAGGRTAAPWRVPPDVTGATVWAALDCPGGWAIIAPGRPYVLGRIAASVHQVPPPGARCVVVGEVVATEGRKAWVRTAAYTGDGELLAAAQATWIALPEHSANAQLAPS